MPSVWADYEEVLFIDGVPDNPKTIYELMMGALAEQRKSVVEFFVDGQDTLRTGSFPENFSKIEAFSMLHDEITMRLISESLKLIENLDGEVDAYSRNILNTPWSEVFKRMDSLIGKIQPFADLVDNAGHFAKAYTPVWSNTLNELANSQCNVLNNILKSFENGDPASLSDTTIIELIPLIKRSQKFFNQEVIPQLEQSIADLKKSANQNNA